MFDIEKQATPKRTARTKTKARLPSGCRWCNGKPWVSDDAQSAGMRRCNCERGKALAEMDHKRAGGAI